MLVAVAKRPDDRPVDGQLAISGVEQLDCCQVDDSRRGQVAGRLLDKLEVPWACEGPALYQGDLAGIDTLQRASRSITSLGRDGCTRASADNDGNVTVFAADLVVVLRLDFAVAREANRLGFDILEVDDASHHNATHQLGFNASSKLSDALTLPARYRPSHAAPFRRPCSRAACRSAHPTAST